MLPHPSDLDGPIEAVCAATYIADRIPAFAFVFRVPATGSRFTVYTRDQNRYLISSTYTLTISDPGHVPLWLAAAEAALLRHCLDLVEERWHEAIAQADAGATRPPADRIPEPNHLNMEPTTDGYSAIAGRFRDELDRVQAMRARLEQILPAGLPDPDGDPS